MKSIVFIFLLLSSKLRACEDFSNSNLYVVCDIPLSQYQEYRKNGYFESISLQEEGFIHCAKPSQLEDVMNKYFEEDHYVLFVSTNTRLADSLKYESKDNINFYPHLYRRFYKEDALAEILVSRGKEGRFTLPKMFIP